MKTLVNHKEMAEQLRAQAKKPILTKERAESLRESIAKLGTDDIRDERKIKKAGKAMKKYMTEAGIDKNFDYDNLEQRHAYLECLRKANEEAFL